MAYIVIGAAAGLLCGFLMALVVSLRAGSWSLGTSLAWGLLIAIPAAIAAIWLKAYAVPGAAVLALLVGAAWYLGVRLDEARMAKTGPRAHAAKSAPAAAPLLRVKFASHASPEELLATFNGAGPWRWQYSHGILRTSTEDGATVRVIWYIEGERADRFVAGVESSTVLSGESLAAIERTLRTLLANAGVSDVHMVAGNESGQ